MKQLTLSLEEEINILDKYKLTCNELMFIRTLLLLQNEKNEDMFQRYIESLRDNGIRLREIISTLQSKGIILKSFPILDDGQPFDPYEIPLNKNFVKNLYRSSFEMGKELFDIYPQSTMINGSTVFLRTVARHFDSLEECYFKYGRAIRWNEERHKEIIELVIWGKENNLICQSLSSFVINNAWLDLKSIKDGDSGNINFDTIKVI